MVRRFHPQGIMNVTVDGILNVSGWCFCKPLIRSGLTFGPNVAYHVHIRRWRGRGQRGCDKTEDRWILQTQVPEPNQNMSTRDKQEIQHTETSTLDLSVCEVVTISPFMADFQSNRSNSFWEQIDIIVLVLWYAAEHNNTHHKYITEYSVCSRLQHIWPNRLTLL